jgi:tripartite-type tricarboxylate transporter receptor subunit TctC
MLYKKILLAVLLSVTATFACAEQTTRVVIGGGPGGLVHRYYLELAPVLGKILGTSVVVDFKPGAGGQIAAELVAKSDSKETVFLLESAKAELISVDELNDLVPVAYLGSVPAIIVARSAFPYRNFKEVLTASKTNKNFSYGIIGSGSHVWVLRNTVANYGSATNIVEVPYKSGANAIIDTLGGQVDVGVSSTTVVQQDINAGNLKGLAVLSEKRSRLLPEVPTLKEQGIVVPPERFLHLFLWASRNISQTEIKKIQAGLADFVKSPAGEEMLNRIDINLASEQVGQPISVLKRSVAYRKP